MADKWRKKMKNRKTEQTCLSLQTSTQNKNTEQKLSHKYIFIKKTLIRPLNDFLSFFLKKSIFSHIKAHGSKFDLAVKKVSVNPRSSFEHTLLGPSPQCCIPSPKVIGPLVPEKKIFKRFLTFYYIWVWWPS